MKKRIALLITACAVAILIIAGLCNIPAPAAKPAQNTTAIEKTEITTEAKQVETADIPSMLILNVEDKAVEIQLNSLPELEPTCKNKRIKVVRSQDYVHIR